MTAVQPKKLRVCLIQPNEQKTKEEILANVSKLIREAVKTHNPRVVALPECFNGPYVISKFHEFAEVIPTGATSQVLSGLAKELNIYLIGGTIIERDANDPKIMYNTCVVWGPDGALLAKHSKTHLCEFEMDGVPWAETENLTAGDGNTIFFIDGVKCGLGICYDAFFDEFVKLYRKAGCEVLFFPSAFGYRYGEFWDVVFRARALLNQVFVAAISPARVETAEVVFWGHSCFVDPYGKIIATADIAEEIVFAEIDLSLVKKFRHEMPMYGARRTDLYDLVDKQDVHS